MDDISDYDLETLTLQGEFIREQIFRAVMKVISECPNCSVMKPCNIPLHVCAKNELAAWAFRKIREIMPPLRFVDPDICDRPFRFVERYGMSSKIAPRYFVGISTTGL